MFIAYTEHSHGLYVQYKDLLEISMILIHSLVFIYLSIIKKQKSFLCTHGLTDIGFI